MTKFVKIICHCYFETKDETNVMDGPTTIFEPCAA